MRSFSCSFSARRTSYTKFGRSNPLTIGLTCGIPELREDVFADGGRRGRGERENGRMPQRRDHMRQAQVRGAKIVPPLADAVRLVDDEERDRDLPQDRDERIVLELLGRDEDDLDRAATDARNGRKLLIFGERRVQRDDLVDAELMQHVDLILHQRDQRAHDDGRPFHEQRGKLIAQRFSRTGRKNCQGIGARQNAGNDFFLTRIKALESEFFAQGSLQIHEVTLA